MTPEPQYFNYSTISRKAGQLYEGIPFRADTNVLAIVDRSKADHLEIVVVGLYKAGTFNGSEGSCGLPFTQMTAVPDQVTADEITRVVRGHWYNLKDWPIRFM